MVTLIVAFTGLLIVPTLLFGLDIVVRAFRTPLTYVVCGVWCAVLLVLERVRPDDFWIGIVGGFALGMGVARLLAFAMKPHHPPARPAPGARHA